MDTIRNHLVAHGNIARRCDLLTVGFNDRHIRAALARHEIFRIRHGWYGLPAVADVVARAIRVGGRLTGLAALRTLGLFLPPTRVIDIAVPRGAAALRSPGNRRARLGPRDGVRVSWIDGPRRGRVASDWITSEEQSLLCVLRREDRETAVACCDALLRYRGWTFEMLAGVFDGAPARVRRWLADVDGRADAWGETVVRLRVRDAGLVFEPQYFIPGVGRLDGRIAPDAYVEVNGRQHDEEWVGDTASSFERDHERGVLVALEGGVILSITYRQIAQSWDLCLRAIRRLAHDANSR